VLLPQEKRQHAALNTSADTFAAQYILNSKHLIISELQFIKTLGVQFFSATRKNRHFEN